MKKLYNSKKLDEYVNQNNIGAFFSNDMKSCMELLLFKKNEHICKENEEIHYLYFFVEGKAKAYNTLSNGKSLLLCFYDGLQVLGDVELIHSQKTSSNVQVMEDSYCIGIPLEKVRVQLLHDATFLRCICDSLAEKLNRLSKNSSINLLYPLENRLASYILATGESVIHKEKKIIFNGNLTETSELLGTSYRHLLRTLNILCDKGVIKKNNGYFEVMDMRFLNELAADVYK
ncbi:transcriptional regulator YeiL [Bacillus sp. DX1.1]|uniref:transcriptional regulator YeiL n=1 Tax=unclassified Bacillus (in: firmicutes) TaxID=185979 RepID=UPI0025700940|nr:MULTISPECIES: transcriptional regulator YeiL [unclassified Bacillus (in: firmicutes)]MDM5155615.1 transcriptional regulator YeiL [Bacillus sp. DX1.1]WJE79922.1 transcriptional regulator YeiL [Bacillus sp. DX3.1]